MKTVLPFVALFLLAAAQDARAQFYHYNVNKGVTAEYDMSAPGGTVIMQSPLNDGFSPPQTIPFAWTFYGNPVAQYRVSDNGYVTFDAAATVSDPANTALPTTAAPNAAIYAYWDNLELSNNPAFMTNEVKTYTVGSAPHRVHVIQWHCTPLGRTANGNYLFFALRLCEDGDFDILLQQIRLDFGSMSGTVGCENADGSDGTMVAGSPDFTYKGGIYLKENVPVYSFVRGAKPRFDLQLASIPMSELAARGAATGVTANAVNHGSEIVSSLEMSYAVGGGAAETARISGLSIAPNQSFAISHPVPWHPSTAGRFDTLSVSIGRVNDEADEAPGDNAQRHIAFVTLGTSAPRHALLEEFSTAPCGYCPDGDLVLEDILTEFPGAIGVVHHSGYRTDAMTTPEGEAIAAAFTTGAPMGAVDRVLWPGQSWVAIGRNDWRSRVTEVLARWTPVAVSVQASWDASARRVDVAVALDFVDYPYPRDLRLHVLIVEDNVTGTGSGYDQTNYYNNTPGHPMFGLGDPIVGYVHRHVVRALPTGAWGEAIFPASIAPGLHIDKEVTATLPASVKERDVRVVAFVANHDGARRDILNSAISGGIVSDVSGTPPPRGVTAEMYPNPFRDRSTIELSLPAAAGLKIEVRNALGEQVDEREFRFLPAGVHRLVFDASRWSAGMYFYFVRTPSGVQSGRMLHLR